MASLYVRLLDARTLTANFLPERDDAIDAGAYTTVHFDCRMLKVGSGGNVFVEHAAVNEPDAFRALAGATWACTGAGAYVAVTGFLRFLRVRGDGAVAGAPVVILDLVAKE